MADKNCGPYAIVFIKEKYTHSLFVCMSIEKYLDGYKKPGKNSYCLKGKLDGWGTEREGEISLSSFWIFFNMFVLNIFKQIKIKIHYGLHFSCKYPILTLEHILIFSLNYSLKVQMIQNFPVWKIKTTEQKPICLSIYFRFPILLFIHQVFIHVFIHMIFPFKDIMFSKFAFTKSQFKIKEQVVRRPRFQLVLPLIIYGLGKAIYLKVYVFSICR